MTTDQLLDALTEHKVTLFFKEGSLRYRAPSGALTQDLRETIACHRSALIERLRQEQKGERIGAVRKCVVCKPKDWIDESPRINLIRTVCGKCGRFIGYRPIKL